MVCCCWLLCVVVCGWEEGEEKAGGRRGEGGGGRSGVRVGVEGSVEVAFYFSRKSVSTSIMRLSSVES